MAKEVKFTDDELKQLQELQNSYQEKQIQFGQLKVQKMLLQQQRDSIEDSESKLEVEYSEIQGNERKIVEELNKKYGPGSLNPETGMFTPTETTEKS
jgi:predicted nuclease with TOPRIM domain